MNVEIGTETPIFLFWEYLFRNFEISVFCLCSVAHKYTMGYSNKMKNTAGSFKIFFIKIGGNIDERKTYRGDTTHEH